MTDKNLTKKEIEKLYNEKFKWVKAGNALKSNFGKTINNNPKLKWILILSITANIGIWLTFISINL
jgi:hypothetical protein